MALITPPPQTLPVPDFYNPKHAADWAYQPDAQALLDHATHWRQQHAIKPAESAKKRGD